MDHLNPVPDRNGNLSGFIVIALVVIGVFLFVPLKNHFWISDWARLVKETSEFIESLPEHTTHIALRNTHDDVRKTKKLWSFYQNEENVLEKAKLGQKLASALLTLGEQYLRVDGVLLSQEFNKRYIDQLPADDGTVHSLEVTGKTLFLLSLFDLTGDIEYRENLLELIPILERLGIVDGSEIEKTIYIVSRSSSMLLKFLEPLKSKKPPDYQNLALKLEELVHLSSGTNPHLESAIYQTIGHLFAEQFETSSEPAKAKQALNALEKSVNVFITLSGLGFPYYSDWGINLVKQAEIKLDKSLGHRALDKCRLASEPKNAIGFTDWIDAQKCFAAAHRVLAEVLKEPQHLVSAHNALQKVLDVLDPVNHRYIWAETKLELGQVYSRRVSIPLSPKSTTVARVACTDSLKVFEQLNLSWMIKKAQECLDNMSNLEAQTSGSYKSHKMSDLSPERSL